MQIYDLYLCFESKGLLLGIFLILLALYFWRNKDPPNFPPGPPALPLLGNIFNIEAKQPHIYLTKVRRSLPLIYTVQVLTLNMARKVHFVQ